MTKKIIYSICALIVILFFQQNTWAQNNFGFYGGMQKMPQSHQYNPVFNADNKVTFSIGTGSHSLGLSNSGFTLNNLLVSRPQDDSLVFSPSGAVSKMSKLNFLDFHSI